MKSIVSALLLVLLADCSSKTADLVYAPTVAVAAQGVPAVASVAVTDARDEKDPKYIGSIRGGFGNPLKTLTAAQPVSDEVAAAFTAALQARGLYGQGAPMTLAITLKQLSGNWYERREGHTIFSLALLDRGGRTVFRDDEDVLKVEGSIVTFNAGVFASIDDLQAVVDLSLATAIDQALDKLGFRAAVGGNASGT